MFSWFRKKKEKTYVIIVGVQKGGTTSLFEYLKDHPSIVPSVEKEVHYFDNNYELGKEWYNKQFPIQSQCRYLLEASPYYIFHPHALSRIKQDLKNVKIITLLRNPIDRAFSHYQMEYRRGADTSSTFEIAIENEQRHLTKERVRMKKDPLYKSTFHQTNSYLERGHYDEQIKQLLSYFDKTQLLFLKSESLFSDPSSTMLSVFNFLNLEPLDTSVYKPFNEGKYHEMPENLHKKLAVYFKNKTKELPQLIGEEFQW